MLDEAQDDEPIDFLDWLIISALAEAKLADEREESCRKFDELLGPGASEQLARDIAAMDEATKWN